MPDKLPGNTTDFPKKKRTSQLSLNPLFSLIFTLFSSNKKPDIAGLFCWWHLPESNGGHTDFQSVALPTELRCRTVFSVQNIIALKK